MTTRAKPIPEGFHTVTPYLIVRDGARAVEFYKKAFAAKEMTLLKNPSGNVTHAEMKIGDSKIMIGEHSETGAPTPNLLPPVSIHLYVEDVDALTSRAIAAGAKELYPVKDHYYGDRGGGVEDPFGIVWWISTHKEDVTLEEMQRRAAASGRK